MDELDIGAAVIVLLVGILWSLLGIKNRLSEILKKLDAKK